jgi:hypothetical protein
MSAKRPTAPLDVTDAVSEMVVPELTPTCPADVMVPVSLTVELLEAPTTPVAETATASAMVAAAATPTWAEEVTAVVSVRAASPETLPDAAAAVRVRKFLRGTGKPRPRMATAQLTPSPLFTPLDVA